MKTLVTGGAGFIGNHLVKRLMENGDNIIVLDNLSQGNKLDKDVLKNIELVVADVRDENIVMKSAKKCDLIFHFAAVLGVDIVADNPIETMETEVLGTKNVCHAAIKNGVQKIIYSSTSGVYGKTAIQRAVDEEVSVNPRSSYSIAKRFNEMYLAAFYQEKKLHSISLRYFNAYGPKQDSRMVIPRFFNQALQGQPLTIYGTGNQTRDFTYIDDIVEATIKSARQVSGCKIFNVSNNREYSIKELAEKIVKLTGSRSMISYLTPPAERYDFEVERRFGCSDKLKNMIDFSPNTKLEAGLSDIYDYINKHEKK